jgi:hypothetical protein
MLEMLWGHNYMLFLIDKNNGMRLWENVFTLLSQQQHFTFLFNGHEKYLRLQNNGSIPCSATPDYTVLTLRVRDDDPPNYNAIFMLTNKDRNGTLRELLSVLSAWNSCQRRN